MDGFGHSVNLLLITISLMGLCAQYCLVWHNRHESFVESADAICTANQAWISIFKMIYLVFVQHKFYDLLHAATDGNLLYDLGVFDLVIMRKLISGMSPSSWYNCCWYNESPQFKYIINMMVLRANRTLYLQVSGFTTMSHMTLLSIVQTSGSYFLLLRNLSGMD
uniref:Odorant receptor n=1 Tax=Glossina austeni TaxID=7395 RepID=A0A1A9UFZ6_GLOAU